MAPQITVLHPPTCKHARKLERRGLFFTPGSALYFPRRSSERRPGLYRALSIAASIAVVASRRIAFCSPYTSSNTRCVFYHWIEFYLFAIAILFLFLHLSGRFGATSLPLFHITVVSRGQGIPRPDLGGDLAPRATGISRGLPGESSLVIRRYIRR